MKTVAGYITLKTVLSVTDVFNLDFYLITLNEVINENID